MDAPFAETLVLPTEDTPNLLPLFISPKGRGGRNHARSPVDDVGKRGSLRNVIIWDVMETVLEKLASLLWPVLLITAVLVYGSHSVLINLSKDLGRIAYNSASVVFMIELLKLVASVLLWLVQPTNEWSLKGFTHDITLWKSLPFAVPAVLYAVNNNLVVHMQLFMDPASFQMASSTVLVCVKCDIQECLMLSNLKIVSTALLYRYIMKRELSSIQWFAIFLLVLSGSSNSYGSLQFNDRYEGSEVFVTISGLTMMSVYCLISGMAGVFTEYILKRHYHMPLSVQNFILYSYGVPLNFLAYLVSSWYTDDEYFEDDNKGIFYGYNIWTVAIIITQALNGLIMSAVMKHASNITRLFIIACAMVVTTLLSMELLGLELNTYFCSAFGLVFVALCLYNM